MSARLRRVADGDLLRRLDPDERHQYDLPRGSKPAAGTTVRLWRLGGTWSVWSAGPETGTWWVRPMDAMAHEVVELLAEMPVRGLPAVVRVTADAIAVRSKDIRPGGAR